MADLSQSSWSETDAQNNQAAPLGWTPGVMLPTQVEPTAQAMMGAMKRYWNRQNPTYSATLTTTDTYTVSPQTPVTSYTAFELWRVRFPSANLTTSPTVTLGPGAALIQKYTAGSLGNVSVGDIQAKDHEVYYNGAAAVMVLTNPGLNGNVNGPASSATNNLPAFTDTTGKNLGDSGRSYLTLVAGPASSTSQSLAVFSNTSGTLLGNGFIVGTGANQIVQLDGSAKLPAVDGSALTNLRGSVAKSAIAGLIPTSISGTSTTAAVTISAGQASDGTGAAYVSTVGNTSWAVSNGNAINGYAGGTTLPNSSTINFFLCSGGSGTGTYASTSLSPTCPTGYATYYRYIFSLVTSSAGALLNGTAIEVDGGAMKFYLASVVTDMNGVTVGTTAVLQALTVPTGFGVEWFGRVGDDSASNLMLVTSPNETDVAVGSRTTNPGADLENVGGFTGIASFSIVTNTSGQIRLRCSGAATSNGYVFTRGWTDFRRN